MASNPYGTLGDIAEWLKSALSPSEAQAFYAGPNATGYQEAQNAGKTFRASADNIPRFEVSDYGAMYAFIPKGHNIVPKEVKNSYTLPDIIKHPKLYEQYPDAKGINVSFLNPKSIYEGGYAPEENTIYLQPTAGIGTILHELQHWIQNKENMWQAKPYYHYIDQGGGKEAYLNDPAEVEARDVALRRLFSEEQRRKVEPYTIEQIRKQNR